MVHVLEADVPVVYVNVSVVYTSVADVLEADVPVVYVNVNVVHTSVADVFEADVVMMNTSVADMWCTYLRHACLRRTHLWWT